MVFAKFCHQNLAGQLRRPLSHARKFGTPGRQVEKSYDERMRALAPEAETDNDPASFDRAFDIRWLSRFQKDGSWVAGE
jgi:hypothetical protein